MGFYPLLLCLCVYLLYVLVEEIFQNYFHEIGLNKTHPLTIDVIKKITNLIIENKICSKFKKPLPPVPQSNDFYSIKTIYFIVFSIALVFIGYISGIQKQKKCISPFHQNIQNRINPCNSDYNDPSTCCLCLNVFKPTIVLLPCKHICMCTICWITFCQESSNNCPICRENIEEVMDVYST